VRHTRSVRRAVAHRRKGSPGPLLPIVAGLVVLPVAVAVGISGTMRGGARAGDHPTARPPARPAAPPAAGATSRRADAAPRTADPRLTAFATWRNLRLYLTAVDVRCVCYHEASYHDAMALHPLGRMRHDYNTTKFPSDEPATAGPDYVIMSSRGRDTPATSAADLVMPRRTRVLSPVTGVVTKVKRYLLYGRYVDYDVEVRPDAAPAMRISMIHLDRLRVRDGDAVQQGITVLGVPRTFPFGDQTDLYFPGGNPHVHLEVVDPTRDK
jgi:hypothetical protein